MLFREVNERIAGVSPTFGADAQPEFLCECGQQECVQPLPMSLEEYEQIRSEADRFAVARGHEEPSIERVVGANDRFLVVEKIGEAGDLAADTDPRYDAAGRA